MSDQFEIGGRVWILKGAMATTNSSKFLLIIPWMAFTFLGLLYFLIMKKFRRVVQLKERSEIRTEEVESWQNAVLDSADYSIISTHPDGTISTFNKAAEKILGFSSTELIGKKSPAVFHDMEEIIQRAKDLSIELKTDIAPGFEAFVAKAKVKGSDTNEWTYINKSGERIPVRLCVTVMKDSSDEIIGYLGVAEDLRTLKKMEKIIEEQKLTMLANAKMSALGEMAAGVAHEINNPLAIITGRVAILKLQLEDKTLDEKSISEGIEKIHNTCFRISKIIQGLRIFSRESSNDSQIEVTVGSIIEDTLSLCRERLVNHAIKIQVSGDLNSPILCRPVQISQVLMNLIGNSVDAIDDLSEKWIKINCIRSDNLIRVEVTDSGKGIASHIVSRMMDPFFTSKPVGHGTGLGLSISKGIIESHDGKLYYKMNEGHTQFVIEFSV